MKLCSRSSKIIIMCGIISLLLISLLFLDCSLVDEEKCFGMYMDYDDLVDRYGSVEGYCKNKGFDEVVSTRAINGHVTEICCKKNGIF